MLTSFAEYFWEFSKLLNKSIQQVAEYSPSIQQVAEFLFRTTKNDPDLSWVHWVVDCLTDVACQSHYTKLLWGRSLSRSRERERSFARVLFLRREEELARRGVTCDASSFVVPESLCSHRSTISTSRYTIASTQLNRWLQSHCAYGSPRRLTLSSSSSSPLSNSYGTYGGILSQVCFMSEIDLSPEIYHGS